MRLLRYLPHFRVVSHLVPFGPTWIHNALKVLFTFAGFLTWSWFRNAFNALFTALWRGSALGSASIRNALNALFFTRSLGSAWFHLVPQFVYRIMYSNFARFRAWFRLVLNKRCFRFCENEGRSHFQSVAAITRCHLQSVAGTTRCRGKSWNPQKDFLLYLGVALEFAKTRDQVISKALRL